MPFNWYSNIAVFEVFYNCITIAITIGTWAEFISTWNYDSWTMGVARCTQQFKELPKVPFI